VNKVELLKLELDFNETLAGALETLQVVAGLLDSVQDAATDGDLDAALGKLENAREVLKGLDGFSNTRVAVLLERRVGVMRELLVEKVLTCWSALVVVDTEEHKIAVLQERDRKTCRLCCGR
jgi:hypothetical protein